jgi:hypothetical protein
MMTAKGAETLARFMLGSRSVDLEPPDDIALSGRRRRRQDAGLRSVGSVRR